MKNANKADFIAAYMYCYGATKKEAGRAYKDAKPAYIAAVIESQKGDARRAFYAD